ncbi:MAG: hypothetical protein ACXVMS_03515 [Flavisolibacter sp.]
MKSTEKHVETHQGARLLSIPFVRPGKEGIKGLIKTPVYLTENSFSSLREMSARISRRYSFDDNGGGYQGL